MTLDHPPLNLFDEAMIEAVIEAITRQARRSNRSFNEMVQHLLAQSR